MYEAFWRFFVDLKIAEEYYLLYVQKSKRYERMINIAAMLGSVAGIASFFGTWFHPIVSAAIVLLSQVASVIQPLYPFSNRVYAGNCIHNDIASLSLEAERLINQFLFGDLDENALLVALGTMKKDFSQTERRFASADLFPRKKMLHKKAQANAEAYLNSKFNIGG